MSKTQEILIIIQAALTALAAIPATALPADVGLAFLQILQTGMQMYQTETGAPLDLTKIPPETKVA